MMEQLTTIIDALADIKLLPRHPSEADVLYGYVARHELPGVVGKVVRSLAERGYEVHRCEWEGEVVLLALNSLPRPLAIRLTSSSTERYNLYALSRPPSAQMLWQWAQAMVRQNTRKRRGHFG